MTYKESRYSCMNEIKGYVIRKRYISGEHKGQSYILIREGYVKDDTPESISMIFEEDLYKTKKGVKISKSNYERNYKTPEVEYEIVEVK